jgi:hypothetical protein
VRLALFLVMAACVIAASGSARAAGPERLVLAGLERRPEPPVYVVMPPPPEPAPPEPNPEPAVPEGKLENGGAEVTLGTLFFQPALGQTMFEGEGTPLGANHRESFRHRGRELGINAPLMWGGELSVHYLRRYFAVGVTGFIAGHPGGADATSPTYSPPAGQVNPSAIMGYGAGIDLAGALPLGPVAFRAGGVLGIRGFSIPLSGFEKKTCHSKGRSYPCDEDATTGALLFFEPRVRLEVTAGRSGVVLGGYVGMDVVGGTGPTAGLFIGVHTPHSTLQP